MEDRQLQEWMQTHRSSRLHAKLSKLEKDMVDECTVNIAEDPYDIEPYLVLIRMYNKFGDNAKCDHWIHEGKQKFPTV
jgi:hypothetical protein